MNINKYNYYKNNINNSKKYKILINIETRGKIYL